MTGLENKKKSGGWRLFGMIIMPALMLGLGAAGFWLLMVTKSEVKPNTAKERAWVVSTQAASFSTLQPELKLYGEVVAGRKVDLRTLVSGEIVSVGKGMKDGASVSTGDELIHIDKFDYQIALDEAKSRLAEARASLQEIMATISLEKTTLIRSKEQLELAERDYKRAVKLHQSKTIAQNVVDNRQLLISQRSQALEQHTGNLGVQKARAAKQEAVIARLEQGVLRARKNLKSTVLRAPFDGYIARTNADKGRFVSVNDRIATLIARDHADVRFTLSDRQYGRILVHDGSVIGREIKIIWRVGANPFEFTGTIDRTGAEISANTGGVYAYARISGAPDKLRALRPGAFVEVTMKDRAFDQVIRLPESAIYGSERVYVVDKDRLVERSVTVVGHAGSDILVSGDIKNGEPILTTRLSQAGSGLLVKAVE